MAGLRAGFADLSKSDQFDYLTELHAKLIAAARAGQMTKQQFIARDNRLNALLNKLRPRIRNEDEADALAERKRNVIAARRFDPSVEEAE